MQQQLVREELFPWLDKLIFAVFVLFLPFALGSGSDNFSDGDVSWHIAAGQWILSNKAVPSTDPFSFTMNGQPWVAFEWLSQIIYAGAFDKADYSGVAAVMILAVMALHLIVFIFLRGRVDPVALMLSFVAMDAILIMFLLARPHLLVWPVIALWTAILLNCRDKNRAPPLALALLMVLWVNLHGSFVIGFLIAGAIGLDAVTAAKWNRNTLVDWIVFGFVTTGAALCNANGLNGLLHPFTVMGLETLGLIREWKASNPSDTPFFYVVLIGSLAALLMKGSKLALGELILLLVLLLLAFIQMRQQCWLAIVAPLILAPRLVQHRRPDVELLFRSGGDKQKWITAATVIGLLMVWVRIALPLRPTENMANPRTLLAQVPVELRSQPVFNGYSFGGPLILAGIEPYIDGRSDMYGDVFMTEYVKITEGDIARFDRAVRRYGISWTILPPNLPLTRLLDDSPEWHRIYQDRVGVIHVRRTEHANTKGRIDQ